MKKLTKFYFLMSIILILNKCSAFFLDEYSKRDLVENNEKDSGDKDNYYIVIFNNTFVSESGNLNKRSFNSKEENIASTMNGIHNIILDNKDQYDDIEKFKEIEINSAKLRKRDGSNEHDNGFVYELASIKDKSSVYAYLSPKVIRSIKSMPNVIDCVPRRKIQFFSNKNNNNNINNNYFNKKVIEKETQWKHVKVKKDSPIHLSLISQGKFNDDIVGQYDRNYYYPESAGDDIDIFDLDTGFYFGSSEFSNKKDRAAKCIFEVRNGTVNANVDSNLCYGGDGDIHGQVTSIIAAGKNRGVAPKANIYGISLSINANNEGFMDEFIVALKYIKDHLLRPHKAVFNLSFGDVDDGSNSKLPEDIVILQDLINEMAEEGAVFIAASGNSGLIANDPENNHVVYPCVLDNVICIGGINNDVLCDSDNAADCEDKRWKLHENVMTTKGYKVHPKSNYGRGVDLYAPLYATFDSEFYFDESYYKGHFEPTARYYNVTYSVKEKDNGYFVKNFTGTNGGTSISSPIVAGIAATIMSEHPGIKFNSTEMLKFLRNIGEKDILEGVPEGSPNIFVNNGKHLVYSSNKVYHGCGIHAGNKKCAHNKCCSANGYCTTDKEECKTSNGCQKSFGMCKITKSEIKGRCGKGFGSCPLGYCCSSYGYCGKSLSHCKVGCQKNYGICL
ncbi:carbohydrate-binding module family 18 protein [Piromyces sp. E2]|nr:carbohydrate-binding module family 18 protein [Piromyces sp. E2]|eukprot:OUM60045.1 carbohydrate-binding module family 18 protein [Piromyces sp. E2]